MQKTSKPSAVTEAPGPHRGRWWADPLHTPAAFSKAPPTPLVNPREQTISTFVNYMRKNGPVVSRRVNGAGTMEGLAWIIPTLNGAVWGWTAEWETQLTGHAIAGK